MMNDTKEEWYKNVLMTWITLSHADKVMLKTLKLGFSRTWTENFQTFQARFKRGRGTRDQIANIRWIMEKAKEFQKNYFCFIDYAKPLIMSLLFSH